MVSVTLRTTGEAAEKWQQGLSLIMESMRQTRDWVKSKVLSGPPCCRDLAAQMHELSLALQTHFQHSNDLYELIKQESWCIEIESAQRQADADQRHLLARLEALIMLLEDAEPPYASFEQAQDQLEWIFDDLEQLEEREADSFEWLIEAEC